MSATPLYQEIYDTLRGEILAGKYAPGTQLPTEKQLCNHFSVSRITAKHALDMLAQDGFIERIKGKGSVVLFSSARDNPQASPLRNVCGKLLGVILSDVNEAFGLRVVYGIEAECKKNNMSMILRCCHGDLEQEQKAINDLTALGVCGLVIIPITSEYYNTSILQLVLGNFPVVILDRQMKGHNTCYVGTDNTASTREAMDLLFSLGHKTIAWISSPAVHMSTLEEREQAVQNSFLERGLVPNRELWYQEVSSSPHLHHKPDENLENIHALAAHFRKHPEITAVFASEYLVALYVKYGAEAAGLSIPDDLSVVCFDSPEPLVGIHEFTHIRQEEEVMGSKAVSLLLAQVSGHAKENKEQVRIPAKLVVGRSTTSVTLEPNAH
ncbi:MAG: GntR family transcriptional regulator [Oscillospiraceae bacterium]